MSKAPTAHKDTCLQAVQMEHATVIPFYDEHSSTFSYIVCENSSSRGTSKRCAIIDSVMGFDYAAGRIHHQNSDAIIDYVKHHNLQVEWVLETHVHADHLSAAPYIQEKVGGKLAIGEHIVTVQNTFGKYFNEGTEFKRDGSQFDQLLKSGESIQIGGLTCQVLHTPGHTPACVSYVIDGAVFVGDTLFMPDGGTARADFPGGDAGILYDSIQTILSLPEETLIFMCHDYCPNGRELAFKTSVKAQKAQNIHVKEGVSRDAFVHMRQTRDATLAMPRLIFPSLQVNMRAGHIPPAEGNNVHYLKVPLNLF